MNRTSSHDEEWWSPGTTWHEDSASELYHCASGLDRDDLLRLQTILTASTNKTIHEVTSRPSLRYRNSEPIPLPDASDDCVWQFGSLVRNRRSEATFGPGSLSLRELSTLLCCGNGVTAVKPSNNGVKWNLRAAPSGGGLYPIEMFMIIDRVEGLPSGIYRFDAINRSLDRVRGGVAASMMDEAFLAANLNGRPAVAIVLVAFMGRSRFKYGERAYRFALLEAGHISQNLLLASTGLGLTGLPFGGALDATLDSLLELNGVDEISVYVNLFGRGA